jgi:hypothetical protein
MDDIIILDASDSEYDFIIQSESDDDDVIEQFENLNIEEYKTILCVDVGVNNLGLSCITYDDEYNFVDVIGIDLLNITEFKHPEHITTETCTLKHTRTFSDWLEHVFIYYKNMFETVDRILIERQPPQGFVVVEQLIFGKYRHKTELIHPSSVHSFFHISHLDYEGRKDAVENISSKYITLPEVLSEYNSFERKHDIADSITFGLFWLKTKQKDLFKIQRKNRILAQKMIFRNSNLPMKEWFNLFRYVQNPNGVYREYRL